MGVMFTNLANELGHHLVRWSRCSGTLKMLQKHDGVRRSDVGVRPAVRDWIEIEVLVFKGV